MSAASCGLLCNALQSLRAQTVLCGCLGCSCCHSPLDVTQLLTALKYHAVQAHITGLPAEVAATPFGQMIIPMLQPALEQRFGNATATRFEPPPRPTPQLEAPATSAGHAQSAASLQDIDPGSKAAEAVKAVQEGGNASTARKAFQAALEEEFKRVQAEGVADANAAGAEAVKRVMLSVRQGLVSPPVQAATTAVRS